jgi:hypothetical protein
LGCIINYNFGLKNKTRHAKVVIHIIETKTPQAKGYIEEEKGGKKSIGVPKIQPRCKNEH